MKIGLIGFSGFVGSNFNNERFDYFINSKNISEFNDSHIDTLVVAAGDARKWYANQNPLIDLNHIINLFNSIIQIKSNRVILFSTIDVYSGVKNDEICNEDYKVYPNQPYGLHRFFFEELIRSNYKNVTIFRLPALFGRGLKKNLIYDIKNNRIDELKKYHLESSFQYFNLNNLDSLLDSALSRDYGIFNVTSEPISVKEIVQMIKLDTSLFLPTNPIVNYNIKSKYSESGYHYTKQQIQSDLIKFISINE